MKKIVISVIILIGLVCSNAFSLDWDVAQFTDNGVNDESPFLNNNGGIVWSGWDGKDYEIFYSAGNTVSQLTYNNYADCFPQINDSGTIVWTGYDTNGSNVFMYANSVTARLTDNMSQVGHTSTWAQINTAGDIVWHDWDGNDYEVYKYDHVATTVTQLTNNSVNDYHPDINNSGAIEWHQWDGNDYEIMLNNAGTVNQITNNTWDDIGLKSQLNDNGEIVWYGFKDGTNFYGPTDSEIYYFNGTEIILLTDDGKYQSNPTINNLGYVTWDSEGMAFIYKDGQITTLGVDGFLAGEVVINNLNDLAWVGYSAGDSEIFTATATPEPCSMALFGIGGLMLGLRRRFNNRRKE